MRFCMRAAQVTLFTCLECRNFLVRSMNGYMHEVRSRVKEHSSNDRQSGAPQHPKGCCEGGDWMTQRRGSHSWLCA